MAKTADVGFPIEGESRRLRLTGRFRPRCCQPLLPAGGMVEDWKRRDLRILEIVAGSESRDADGVRLTPLAKDLDLEEADLRRGFEALEEAGYISFGRIVRGGMGGTVVIAPRLREKGRRTLKLWPGNSFEALIDVLEQRIRDEPEPEKRSRLQGLLAAVRAVGGPALAEILAKLVEHQIGMP